MSIIHKKLDKVKRTPNEEPSSENPDIKKNSVGKKLVVGAGILAAAGLVFYLYYSMESEKRLRIEAQSELAKKTDELSQKESALLELEQQKNDQAQELNTKIADLESSLKDSEDKRKELVDKANALQNDLADKDESLENLTKKYATTERENLKLIEENKRLKGSSSISQSVAGR